MSDFVDFIIKPFCPKGYVIAQRASQMPRLAYLRLSLAELKEKIVLLKISEHEDLTHGIVIVNNSKIRNKNLCGSQPVDSFLKNPAEIPIEWHGKKILFLGTFFEKEPKFDYVYMFVSCLYEDDGVWTRKMVTLNRSFDPKVYVVAALKN
ncbi:MAG: hypothetical protein WC827_03360 [Candidatus Paceibacterota bacterium]|jgi:hypothetical protein